MRWLYIPLRALSALLSALGALLSAVWPSARTRRQLWRGFRATPGMVQLILGACALALVWLSANWTYQVARKPAELFFPLSGTFAKSPEQLWRAHGNNFRAHSTSIITPAFLAALAYLESAGDPIARTYWRWQPSFNPLRWYAPASSAVGMYQLTDGTFAEMKRYCIHDHRVVEDGPWHEPRTCWFNALYLRALPSDAIEMTSAYLDRQVRDILERAGRRATSGQRRELAGLIHLCGTATAQTYAARGFTLQPGHRCGDHPAAAYLARLNALQAQFLALERTDQRR